MIQKFAHILSKWLLKAGSISEVDQELYEYGIYSFLFTMVPLLAVILLSFPMHMILEGILFIIPFILLRKFTGGFHFSSALLCALVSTMVLLAFLLGIKAFLLSSLKVPIYIAVYLSLIPIVVFSPIDSANRRLSQNEKCVFRKIAITLGLFFATLFTLLMVLGIPRVAVPIGAGVILTSLLQLPCLWELRKNISRG